MIDARCGSYVICTTPRSGSTLLCRLLAATGRAGRPDSHFHTPSLAGWLQAHGLCGDDFDSDRTALAAVVVAARAEGTDSTGMFGLRMQGGSLVFFLQQLRRLFPGHRGDAARIDAAFGPTRFIHLSRRDKLDQAISLVKARQTGLWHRAADGSELERLSPQRTPVYDAAAISREMAELRRLDKVWRAWFQRTGVQPLSVTYAALSRDPRDGLATVLDHLGLDRSLARDVAIPTARLSDGINQDWAAQFRRQGAT